MYKLLLILICLLLQGCASVEVSVPQVNHFKKTQSYPMSFNAAWNRVVDWFADHNIVIDKIEKSSGLLTAKYLLTTNSAYLNCGKMKLHGFIKRPEIMRFGALNVTIRKVNASRTRVHVNFFGKYKLKGRDVWDGSTVIREGRCVSTGQLEKSIFAFLGVKNGRS